MTRVVAIADSDSYLKWSAATLAAMPAGWRTEQWLVRSPIAPSPAQVQAATDLPVARVSLARALLRLRRETPDVLVLAATGPVVQAILSFPFLRYRRRRPVLVTGLPGISVPATDRAVAFRSGCDVFVLHSRREVTEFAAIAARLGQELQFGLATLPFIRQVRQESADRRRPVAAGPAAAPATEPERPHADGLPDKIIFAAQAKVPVEEQDRLRVLRAFAELPPRRKVVIKLRALPGEQQTHRERLPYPELWDELVTREGLAPDLVDVAGGSMADALADADGFVTVSSTAALEAIGLGVPILVLNDFGVSAEMINEVFVGSGCLGSLGDLARGELHQPRPEWLDQNYFHQPAANDWLDIITGLVARRRADGLPARRIAPVDGRARLLRRQLRLALPEPVLRQTGRVARRIRRIRRSRAGMAVRSSVQPE
jgi:hypothetical protein